MSHDLISEFSDTKLSMMPVNFVRRPKSAFMSSAQTILSKSFAFKTSLMAESFVCNSVVSKSAVLGSVGKYL